MKRTLYFSCLFVAVISVHTVSAQGLFKKLKDKVSEKINPKTDNSSSNNNNSDASTGKPVNKVGGGLTNTPAPDVKSEMADAEAAHTAKKYSDARYALSQALMGVEIQLGNEILKSLPTTSDGLEANTSKDVVMSTQWGWSNLNIQRVWENKNDKQMTITIGNAGIYAGLAAMYFTNAAMVETNNNKQNFKQTRVKGNKAIIQYEDNTGYTLIVSLGQSSMMVWECVNFATEQEVMNTANSFDIDGIKKMLGEQ
jgi:hypothetical protein